MKPVKGYRRVGRFRPSTLWAMAAVGILIVALALFGYLFTRPETVIEKESDSKPAHRHEMSVQESGNDEEEASIDIIPKVQQKQGYAVSACNETAARAAAEVLENGGNAADAAVALAYTLAVAEPYASGLGGGGCLLLYDPETERYVFYNYCSEAGLSGSSTECMVPGFVSGMQALLEDYGTRSYKELLQPAIDCCDGVTINATLAKRIDSASGLLDPSSPFFEDGEPLAEGDRLVQPELKNTLIQLAEEGADSFYTGKIAEDLTAAQIGLTAEDLAAYETIRSEAVVADYSGYTVASAAAPYSGVTLIQMLKMAEQIGLPNPQEDAVGYLDGLQRVTFTAYQDRSAHVYDLRFAQKEEPSQEEQTADGYVSQLLGMDFSEYEAEEEGEDTTAFTIIDQNGMVVACTNTLSSFFGIKRQVDGFYLNNTGTNFGVGVNAYAPGKRPRSHIAPTILRSENETIAIASPGGEVIVKVLASLLMDMTLYETPMQEAVDKQRVLFLYPSLIYYETGYDSPLQVDISGYYESAVPYNSHSFFGNAAVARYTEEDGYEAVTDIRREGYGISVTEEEE